MAIKDDPNGYGFLVVIEGTEVGWYRSISDIPLYLFSFADLL